MKLDWKKISQSSGYKSLKKTIAKYVMRYPSEKKRCNNMLQEYMRRLASFVKNETEAFINVLDNMEHRRDYSWMNFYNHELNKLKPRIYPKISAKRRCNQYKKMYKRNPGIAQNLCQKIIHRETIDKRKANGKKLRWPMHRKNRFK